MVDFSFDLIYHHTSTDLASRAPLTNLNQRLNASDYVTIKPNGGFNVIFALNLPKQGLYTFTIYAATTSTTSHRNDLQSNTNGQTELPAVFTYLLRYTWAVRLFVFCVYLKIANKQRVVAFFLSFSVSILCCFLGAGKVWMTLFHLLFLVDKTFPEMSSALCVRVYVYLSLVKKVFLRGLVVLAVFLIYIYISIFFLALSSLSLSLSLCTWVAINGRSFICSFLLRSLSFSSRLMIIISQYARSNKKKVLLP